ncbi:MAG TPA: alpha/beta family hydrolase, partial [Arthrobacter sp.]|nr:alpha/beta family hydrolase [Arthrobacter sp.]
MTIPELPVTISVGESAVSGVYARPGTPAATLVVAHGAGSGMEHPFLAGFTRALNGLGIATLRFNFPYREAGRKFPDKPPAAIAAWRAAMADAAARSAGEPLWAGGKSF